MSIKHISCKCKCKFDGRKCNLNQNLKNNKCWFVCKNSKDHQYKANHFWNRAKCSCENGKYSRSIGNSVVIFDEIIEETKTIPIKSASAKLLQQKPLSQNIIQQSFTVY